MSEKTPPASEAGTPAPAGTGPATPPAAPPADAFCKCPRPSFRWIQDEAGAPSMVCSFCKKSPNVPKAEAAPANAPKVFLGTTCTNCGSHALRHRGNQVVCVECSAVMVEAPSGGTTWVCPKCGRDGGVLRRRRDGRIYCTNDNADAIEVSLADAKKIKSPRRLPLITQAPNFRCPKCGADAKAIGDRGDGRKQCTSCDQVLDTPDVRLPVAPTYGETIGRSDGCPSCKAPARAISLDGNGRAHCTSCDFVLTDAPDPESGRYSGDTCPGCGAPPSAIQPDGFGRPHCTSCDRVLAERA